MTANSGDAIVILGGGIIGLSTAFYLSLAQRSRASSRTSKISASIYVIDPSATLCAGASGQNEGALGDFGYEDKVKPLASLSYALHEQLAAQHHGSDKYGYTGLNIHAVFSNGYDQPHEKLPFPVQEPEALSKLPNWLKVPSSWEAGLIANPPHATKLDPPRFCKFLHEECDRSGVKFLFSSKAVSVTINSSKSELDHVEVSTSGSSDTIMIPCKNLVVAAGSWSERVFSSLFPDARYRIPLEKQQPSQDWLRINGIKASSENSDQYCDQIWLNEVVTNMNDLHISTFQGGDMYIAGDFSEPEDLPELLEEVEAHPDAIQKLLETAKGYLKTAHDDNVRLLSSGRAYLPQTTTGIPIITKLDWEDVFPPSCQAMAGESQQRLFSDRATPKNTASSRGGIFVNVGQYLDGFVLGPGSGKVMSELIMGQKTSVDLSSFQLPKERRLQERYVREQSL